jgi:cytochrome oxidase Cu insertion factor (SCO1/SenC/PrrC family)
MNSHPGRRSLSTTQRYVILGLLSLCLGTVYALVLRRTQSSAASGGEDTQTSAAPDSSIAFNTVAPFTLTDSTGKTVTLDALLGKPWIADFVFTRCTGPCPVVTSFMKKAQDMLHADDVRLVTITVDPEYDTPEVLAQYATLIGADTTRWTFLTGPLGAITALLNKSFMVPIVKESGLPVGESIVHRTNLTVVDARGVVRGYYDGEHIEGVEQAVARARWLAQHPDASQAR